MEGIQRIPISIPDIEASSHSKDIPDISLYILEIIQG